MFNRADTIRRAIESCLAQTYGDFELLVVDDCSTDDSAEIVASYPDPRIRLFRHSQNRGPCPARNTAISESRGEWCVMLDSDFALMPYALDRLRARTRLAACEVGNVASSCEWDVGRVTPFPLARSCILDFPGYLEWISSLEVSEKLECVRRVVFDEIRFPDSRAWEYEFHLDLSSRWKIEISTEVLVKVFSDATNRLTAASGEEAVVRVLQDAPDKLLSFENSLRTHDDALRRWAPKVYENLTVLSATQSIYIGDRRRALRHIMSVLARQPLSAAGWAAGALLLISPKLAAWATVERRRRRA
jgi:glycosyltransferase involved in cell wall biosynthesis